MNDIVSVFLVFFVLSLWVDCSEAFFTETSETILEETNKSRLPYLPIVLFHKVKNILCTFLYTNANALWKGTCVPIS